MKKIGFSIEINAPKEKVWYSLWDDENYFVSDYGLKVMDLVNYLNHSDNPNVISINDGEFFEAIKDILTGEELFIDYETIVSE